MAELKIELEDPYHPMLHSIKPVVETIIEEKVGSDTYVSMVVWRGIRAVDQRKRLVQHSENL